MKSQVLSIEQMQTLKDKGFDTSVASVGSRFCDGIYHKYFKDDYIGEDVGNDMDFMTLQDILEELPKEIHIDKDCYLLIELSENDIEIHYQSHFLGEYINKKTFYGNNLLDCAYQSLLWCINNNHIEAKPQQLLSDSQQKFIMNKFTKVE